jgi:hypothetical protein
MKRMFQDATSFNQNLNSWVLYWNVNHQDFAKNSGLQNSYLPNF